MYFSYKNSKTECKNSTNLNLYYCTETFKMKILIYLSSLIAECESYIPHCGSKVSLYTQPRSFCLSLGIRSAIQRGYNQDGCEQPGHGDGPQLPSVPIRRSADHLREHAQGDVLPENAHRSPGHQFHRRGGVEPLNRGARLGC